MACQSGGEGATRASKDSCHSQRREKGRGGARGVDGNGNGNGKAKRKRALISTQRREIWGRNYASPSSSSTSPPPHHPHHPALLLPFPSSPRLPPPLTRARHPSIHPLHVVTPHGPGPNTPIASHLPPLSPQTLTLPPHRLAAAGQPPVSSVRGNPPTHHSVLLGFGSRSPPPRVARRSGGGFPLAAARASLCAGSLLPLLDSSPVCVCVGGFWRELQGGFCGSIPSSRCGAV